MKIETTTTVKAEIELPIPSFWKDTYASATISDIVGFLDEKTVCRVWESERRTSVENSNLEDFTYPKISEIMEKWQSVSEEEFLQAYNRALHSMSLTPELSKETGALAD